MPRIWVFSTGQAQGFFLALSKQKTRI